MLLGTRLPHLSLLMSSQDEKKEQVITVNTTEKCHNLKSNDELQEMPTWDEYQDFSDTVIHGKLHDFSALHANKPDGETILQEVSVAKTIQGKKARLQDCKNICKGSVGPLICSPSLAKSLSKPTSVDNKNDKFRVENIKVDMREPENGYNLTRMEYRWTQKNII